MCHHREYDYLRERHAEASEEPDEHGVESEDADERDRLDEPEVRDERESEDETPVVPPADD